MVLAAAGLFLSVPGWAQSGGKGVDRLYILDCGQGHLDRRQPRDLGGMAKGLAGLAGWYLRSAFVVEPAT